MTVKFREVGNSIAITIPKDIVNTLGIKQGCEANIETVSNKIIVEPIQNKKPVTIKSLFADYHGNYKPEEIDWGRPVGREVW